jgi:large subunit ribosomal protein L13
MMKTYSTKPSDIRLKWQVIDAEGQILGRLASRVAQILKGKMNPLYVPHLNTGDGVVIVNAEKIVVTGNKLDDKRYYRHSQYPGGLKTIALGDLQRKAAPKVIEHAVKGMLPHNPLGRAMLRRLKVYAGPEHPHTSQTGAMEATE